MAKIKKLHTFPIVEKTYTTFEVSRLCGVFPSTVIYWANKRKLKVFKTPGGHRRITRDYLISFMTKHEFPGLNLLLTGKA